MRETSKPRLMRDRSVKTTGVISPGAGPSEDGDGTDHQVVVRLDQILADHGMTLTELADRVGITLDNLSVLKNGRARAIRFTTLTAICHALDCQPAINSRSRTPSRLSPERRRRQVTPQQTPLRSSAHERPDPRIGHPT